MGLALLTLMHVLIFVYWLGGDMGAFYGSTFMTDQKRSVPERMMALKIINNIDMAPRTTPTHMLYLCTFPDKCTPETSDNGQCRYVGSVSASY